MSTPEAAAPAAVHESAQVSVRLPSVHVSARAHQTAQGVQVAVTCNDQDVQLVFTGTDVIVDVAGG